ncbi:MAG: SCO family protein [Phenylobacterium sp.]|uniref:SCO family protein n=1 Tax=Phenylobacterium sp. TaxID=1871053 RepID=UPI002732B844|nr:SCO family protein [Phenylobacterium sp.]MDP3174207.1 SCO family protein [Phenylobacterium sp.]
MKRRVLWIIAGCVVVAVALAAVFGARVAGRPEAAEVIGGPFQLVDQSGRSVDESLLKGQWNAVFFGFTHCPDVCPTTLYGLAQTQEQLGRRARDFRVVLISVDPVRDTPEQMALYLSNPAFPKGAVGLTGTPAQVASVAKAYRVYHQESTHADGHMQMDHSTVTYLMNPKGRFVCALPTGLTPEQTAERVSKAMRQGPAARNC